MNWNQIAEVVFTVAVGVLLILAYLIIVVAGAKILASLLGIPFP